MKKNKIIICMIFLFVLILCRFGTVSEYVEKNYPTAANRNYDKRACWISYIDIQTYLCDKSETAFRAKVNAMFQNICDNQINTVIIHVRAMGDACYPSEYFPYSVFISSDRSDPGYDPFQIMVDTAHLWGLRVEAWINPYRLSLNEETTMQFQQSGYYEQYKNMILEYTGENGTCLALDPGNADARALIIRQVEEILNHYDVDGIHMDDYFYVDGMQPKLSQAEKKENVNLLIRDLYRTIKEINPNCEFGISPAGNPDYARSQGADIDTWLSDSGYVDYIMPQIYWTDHYVIGENTVSMFTERCRLWQSMNKNQTPMYVGLALYRVGEASDTDLDWSRFQDNLARQCETAYDNGYLGFSLFRYAYLETSSAQEELENLNVYIGKRYGNVRADTDAYITYTSHIQSYGWQGAKADGVVSGTTGTEKRLEAIRVQLGSLAEKGGVTYRTYIQEDGWQVWVQNGEQSGTTGQSKYVEALEMRLNGACENMYDIYYRIYSVDGGWSKWKKNGDTAGIPGQSGQASAIQVKLLSKKILAN